MESKHKNQLERARDFFYSKKLVEAYNIFRLYYSRLPFSPEKEHTEYLGMFVRVLIELGKARELTFYQQELEKINAKKQSPELAYALGLVKCYSPTPKFKEARQWFEVALKSATHVDLQAKAKIMLAWTYDKLEDNVAACRKIIDSIATPDDKDLQLTLDIWRAKILADEKRFDDAEAFLLAIQSGLQMPRDWYPYFSVKVILAHLYLHQNRFDQVSECVQEIREIGSEKRFRSVEWQVEELEAALSKAMGWGTLKLVSTKQKNQLVHANRTVELDGNSATDKLLLLLVKKRFLDKAHIVKNLYDRQYKGQEDDKLIYHHIHSVRKELKRLGIPPEAIESEGKGYRFIPEVEITRET